MEVTGVVKNGHIVLPPAVRLREGAEVRVILEEPSAEAAEPFEREPVSEESVLADIAWATGRRFRP